MGHECPASTAARADDIEAFAGAGVKVIRLWLKWLADKSLVPRVCEWFEWQSERPS